MEPRVRAAGHAVHPVLMVFPLGLLSTSVIFDVLYFVTDDARYGTAAFFAIAAGVIGGLVAGAVGFADWMKIPKGTRAKRVGLVHGLGNEVVLLLFALSWLVRWTQEGDHAPTPAAFVLSLAGAALSGATGWMGSEMVERLGVAVHPGAHLDAPNSLRARVIDLRQSPYAAATDHPPDRPGTGTGTGTGAQVPPRER